MKKQLLYTLAFIAACLVISPHVYVQSTAFNISAGASQSTISSTLASAAATAGATTVNFASGNYNLGSQTTIPCPVGSMTIQGPSVAYKAPADLRAGSYSYATPYLAYLNGSVSGGSGFYLASCTHAITIQYFNWNGGQPSAGGGGFLYSSSSGNSNVTVQYNWIHGMYANTATSHNYDDGIWLDGPQAPTPLDSNITIAWNVFGDGASDCNPIMTLYTYDGGDYGSSGGYCGAIGVHTSTDNIQIRNNDFEHLEEPVKFFAGAGGPGNPGGQILSTKVTVDGNDFGQYHRIAIEAQQVVAYTSSVGSYFNYTNNSFHDTIYASYGLWAISSPACCGGYVGYSSDNENNINNNTIIQGETAIEGGPNGRSAGAVEWWATNATASNNLLQGYWSTQSPSASNPGQNFLAIKWGQSVGGWTTANNQCQSVTTTGTVSCISSEGEQSTYPPTITGNTQTSGGTSAQTSIAPSVAVSGNTVTITDAGRTSGVGPQGNTSSYYTTDGTTPSTSSTFCGASCTFTAANGTVVKALGMWGQQNQPHAYQANYGWTPSSVVTATVAGGGGTPTAATPAFSPGSETFTTSLNVFVNASTTGSVLHCTTNGTTPTDASPTPSGGEFSLTTTTTINCLAAASGYLDSAVATGVYTLSSPAAAPLTSCGLNTVPTQGINTLVVGQTYQQEPYAYYSSTGSYLLVNPGPDVNGSSVTSLTSNTPSVLTIGAVGSAHPGLVSAIAQGTATIAAQVSQNGGTAIGCSGWGWTVIPKTLSSVAITTTGGVTSLAVPNTNQLIATGTYNDGSTAPLTSTTLDWSSSTPAAGTVSYSGLLTAVSAGNPTLTGTTLGAGTTTNNLDDTLTNWSQCYIGGCGSGSPGGTNPPASTPIQTINNASPSLDGESMLLSVTTLASSTQTNALFINKQAACDNCTDISSTTHFYLGANSAHASAFEFDDNIFDVTHNLQITFATQCYQGDGQWQIANGAGSWVDTPITCALGYSAWHSLVKKGFRIIGDTSCGGFPTLHFVSLTIDGTVYPITQTLCAFTLPSGYTTASVATQVQIDIGSTTSAQTVTMNLDEMSLTTNLPGPSGSLTVNTTSGTVVPFQMIIGGKVVYSGTVNQN